MVMITAALNRLHRRFIHLKCGVMHVSDMANARHHSVMNHHDEYISEWAVSVPALSSTIVAIAIITMRMA